MASSELLALVSNDGERYEVSLEVAKVFRAVEAMLESEYQVMASYSNGFSSAIVSQVAYQLLLILSRFPCQM